MQSTGMVASTGECLKPHLTDIFAEYTEEEEDEKALEGVEDRKKDLEGEGSPSDCECTEQPGESKQEHHTTDADNEADGSFCVHPLILHVAGSGYSVLDDDKYNHHKDDHIK